MKIAGQRQSKNIEDRRTPTHDPKYDKMQQMSRDPMVQDQLRQQQGEGQYKMTSRRKKADAYFNRIDAREKANMGKTMDQLREKYKNKNPFAKAGGQ